MTGIISAVARFVSKDRQNRYDEVKRVLAEKSSTPQDLMKARAAIPALIETAEGTCSRLESARVDVLLTDSDVAAAEHDAETARARLTVDRLKAFAEEIESRLNAFRNAEEVAEVLRLRDGATSRLKIFETWLSNKYPALAEEIVAGLRLYACADAAIAKYNSRAEVGQQLPDIETALRRGEPECREEISRKEISLWCYEESRDPLPEAFQAQVRDNGDGTGSLLARGGAVSNGPSIVRRRKFWRVEFFPHRAPSRVDPFAEVLSLPPARSGARPFWNASPRMHYSEILKQIDGNDRASSLPPRRAQVEFIPMPDAADGEGAE